MIKKCSRAGSYATRRDIKSWDFEGVLIVKITSAFYAMNS